MVEGRLTPRPEPQYITVRARGILRGRTEMNLLLASPTYPPWIGGAETMAEDLAMLLTRQGHRVTVLMHTPADGPAREDRGGVEVLRARHHWGRGLAGRLRALRPQASILRWHWRMMRERRVEALAVARFDETAVYPVLCAWWMRLPIVLYMHGGELRVNCRRPGLFPRLLGLALRLCRSVVAVSHDLERELVTFAPHCRARTVVIPSGVRLDLVAAPTSAPEDFCLFAGRLEEVKNVELLLRGFARARDRVDEMRLVIAGGGSLEAALRELSRSLGIEARVTFLGPCRRPEVLGWMRRCRFLVLPSRSEGSPIVALEAMAAGKPVLASDVTGNRDVVAPGVTGLLFRPDDEEDLARRMVEMHRSLHGPATAIGTGAWHAVASRLEAHDLERLLPRHLDLYQDHVS